MTHPASKTSTLLALALATSAILPLIARADGDSDRQANADFYSRLDARSTTAAPEPAQAKHVGFTQMTRHGKATKHNGVR